MKIKNPLTIAVFSILLVCFTAQADFYSEDLPAEVKKQEVQPEAAPSLDPRLPPVIPGQEVNAGGGRRVRMISTTGPVPVATLNPQPSPSLGSSILEGAGIIVDTRKLDKD